MGIADEKGSIPGRIPRPAAPGRAPGTRENKPRGHARHSHPETAKHQAAETRNKAQALMRKPGIPGIQPGMGGRASPAIRAAYRMENPQILIAAAT